MATPRPSDGSFLEFARTELVEIRHPYSARVAPHQFRDIGATSELFLDALRFECALPEYAQLADLFLTAFASHDATPADEIHLRTVAIQAMATKFEPFVKKLALILGHPQPTVKHTSPWRLLGPVALAIVPAVVLPALVANEDVENVSAWEVQTTGNTLIYRTRMARNSLSHTAPRLSRLDLSRLLTDVLGAFLYVTEQLTGLSATLHPPAATEWPLPALRDHCESLLKRYRHVELQQGYVELELSEACPPGQEFNADDFAHAIVSRLSSAPGGKEQDEDPGDADPRTASDVFQTEHRFVLCGRPGAGKTTVTRYAAILEAMRVLNTGRGPVPIYIELNLYRGSLDTLLNNAITDVKEPSRARLLHDEVILYLDGLNEVDSTLLPSCVRDIQSLLRRGHRQRLVITTRLETFYDYFEMPAFMVEDLSEARLREYASKYLGDRAPSFLAQLTPGYRDLARTPLMLTLFARVFYEEGALPSNRSILYERFVRWLHRRAKLQDPAYDENLMTILLEHVAASMQHERKVAAVGFEMFRWLSELRTGVAPDLAMKAMLHAGWLRDTSSGLRFAHQTFQEFFAARHLLSHPEQLGDGRIGDSGWQEVMVFLAGLPQANEDLLRRLRLRRASPQVVAAALAAGRVELAEQTPWILTLSLKDRLLFMDELRGHAHVDLSWLIRDTLHSINMDDFESARRLGAVLRYRERPDDLAPVVDALFAAKKNDFSGRLAATVLGTAHAPIVRDLLLHASGEGASRGGRWNPVNWRRAIREFVNSNGLERLTAAEKARARETFMCWLRDTRVLPKPKMGTVAVRALEQVGTIDDLDMVVARIPSFGNSNAAETIRALARHNPAGLVAQLEEVLRHGTRHALCLAAVETLISLQGGGAKSAIDHFVAKEPHRNEQIVSEARRRVARSPD